MGTENNSQFVNVSLVKNGRKHLFGLFLHLRSSFFFELILIFTFHMKKIFLKTSQKKNKIPSDDVLIDFFINREGAMRRDHLLQKTKSEELGRRRRKSPKRCLRPFFTKLTFTNCELFSVSQYFIPH